MTIDGLSKEALRLAPEARADLARELVSSLDELGDAQVDKLWLEEAVRRDTELDSGSAGSSRVEEVIARGRARERLRPRAMSEDVRYCAICFVTPCTSAKNALEATVS